MGAVRTRGLPRRPRRVEPGPHFVGGDAQEDRVASVFSRGSARLVWSAEATSAGTYRVVFDFENALDGN